MKIGLISDSHDHLDHIRKAAALFRERGVEQVLHAGDFICPSAILALEGLQVAAVLGNNDGETLVLAKTFDRIGGRCESQCLVLETPEGTVALYHGTSRAVLDGLIHSGLHLAVVSGHTHVPLDGREGNTRVLNPGTAHGFGDAATVMIYDTVTDGVELIAL